MDRLQLNIAYPETGAQKAIEIDDDKKLLPFFDKRVAQEVDGDSLGSEWTGYRFRITGGNDKQGFPMMQGVLTPERVRLLLRKGSKCYRQRRTGEMKRKSVRGCIVSQDLSVINLLIVKKGDSDIEGLTDESKPIRLGPKRATKIKKLFGLSGDDAVTKFVVRRKCTTKSGKEYSKAPKIQRLVTKQALQRRRHRIALKRSRAEKNKTEQAAYHALVAQRSKEAKERRNELLMKRRSSHGSTHSATKA
jgi:small subunit ribosomal protein S6e